MDIKRHKYPVKFRISSLFALYICLSCAAYGQENYGKIKVEVKNTLAEPISKAEVKLLQNEKVVLKGKTNDSGIITFNKIQVGLFSLTISAASFSYYELKSLTVTENKTQNLSVTLEILTVEETVEVDSTTGVDKDNYGGKKVLTEKDIQNLPDDPVEFERALRRILGTSITGQKLQITVDDMPLNQLPPKDSIQQIRVDQNIFSARNSNVGGQGIQVITKAGLTKYSGNFMFGFADSRLNAADPQFGERVPNQNRNYQFYLQGPIVKNSSFIFNFYRNERSGRDVLNALTVNKDFKIEEYKATFPAAGSSNGGSVNIEI